MSQDWLENKDRVLESIFQVSRRRSEIYTLVISRQFRANISLILK